MVLTTVYFQSKEPFKERLFLFNKKYLLKIIYKNNKSLKELTLRLLQRGRGEIRTLGTV